MSTKTTTPSIVDAAIPCFEVSAHRPADWKAFATIVDTLARERGFPGPHGYDPTSDGGRVAVATVAEQLLRIRRTEPGLYGCLAAVVFSLFRTIAEPTYSPGVNLPGRVNADRPARGSA